LGVKADMSSFALSMMPFCMPNCAFKTDARQSETARGNRQPKGSWWQASKASDRRSPRPSRASAWPVSGRCRRPDLPMSRRPVAFRAQSGARSGLQHGQHLMNRSTLVALLRQFHPVGRPPVADLRAARRPAGRP
jgi:hypothetical protein